MYKKVLAIFAFVLLVSVPFALAAANDSKNPGSTSADGNDQAIGGDKDEHGCLIAAGYSWNDTEQKCVREWETGEARYQNEEQEQVQNRAQVQDGEHMGEGGQTFRIETQSNNRIRLESDGVSAECDCNMTQEKVQNKTKLNVQLSNGKNAEVKVMPDTASERALERLRLKVCSTDNNCSLELKEVGKGNETQLAYEVQVQRHSRILGIFSKKMQVRAEVSAENGEVLDVDKPWWAFLASEPAEE